MSPMPSPLGHLAVLTMDYLQPVITDVLSSLADLPALHAPGISSKAGATAILSVVGVRWAADRLGDLWAAVRAAGEGVDEVRAAVRFLAIMALRNKRDVRNLAESRGLARPRAAVVRVVAHQGASGVGEARGGEGDAAGGVNSVGCYFNRRRIYGVSQPLGFDCEWLS